MSLFVFEDADALADAVAARFLQLQPSTVALAGGSTPKRLYQRLGGPLAAQVPWHQLAFFLSDERCLPPDHPDSNQRMIQASLLAHATARFYPPPAMDLEAGADRYENDIAEATQGTGVFDLVLLGMGADGHTASLFPGYANFPGPRGWVALAEAPPETPAPRRLTFTLTTLHRAREVWVLVSGADKAARLAEVRAGGNLPLAQVLAGRTHTPIFADRSAAPRNS